MSVIFTFHIFFCPRYCLSFCHYHVEIFLLTFTEWNEWFIYKENMNEVIQLCFIIAFEFRILIVTSQLSG